jgi:hypothetical protein
MVTTMKTLETTLLIILFMSMTGCQKQRQNNRTQMMLDSEVSGKNVTIVRPKEAVRPVESVTDFNELSNIMQYDIDAMQRIPSKEIVYVKRGESVRPSEKRR